MFWRNLWRNLRHHDRVAQDVDDEIRDAFESLVEIGRAHV